MITLTGHLENISFRSPAEVQAELILDEFQSERDERELYNMNGRSCAKRQLLCLQHYEVKKVEEN